MAEEKLEKLEMKFPDIKEALYTGNTFEEIRKLYIEQLRKDGSILNVFYANKLEEGETMLNDHSLHELEQEFHDLKEHLRTWANQKKIHLTLKRRQKDWIGLNEKIQLYLSTGKALAKLLDLLGFRIIICHNINDSIETIKLCYELQVEVINFFITQKHCLLLEAEPRIDTDFESENYPKIIVPKKNYMPLAFENNVKDYIRYPKSNGYQSLHTIVKRPDGLTFEIQIRTFAMDMLAENGTGCHEDYKNLRYLNIDFNIDYTKIHIPGFVVLQDGTIKDIVGLRKSVDPFNFL